MDSLLAILSESLKHYGLVVVMTVQIVVLAVNIYKGCKNYVKQRRKQQLNNVGNHGRNVGPNDYD